MKTVEEVIYKSIMDWLRDIFEQTNVPVRHAHNFTIYETTCVLIRQLSVHFVDFYKKILDILVISLPLLLFIFFLVFCYNRLSKKGRHSKTNSTGNSTSNDMHGLLKNHDANHPMNQINIR